MWSVDYFNDFIVLTDVTDVTLMLKIYSDRK